MFADLKSWSIPEGEVVKVECGGSVLWEITNELPYTNKVPTSIGTDGEILNGVGYVGKTRLSSSGSAKAENYASTTGFIPASRLAIVRVPAEYFDNGSCYVCSYNSSFEFIAAVNYAGSYGGGTVTTNGDVKEITLLDNSNIAYVRVSMKWDGTDTGYVDATDPLQGPCEHMIVTINEEII